MKMHDLGIGPPTASSEDSESRKYYPTTRVPLKAIGNSPTDGTEFMVMARCCVRSIDNKENSGDLEIKAIGPMPGKPMGSHSSEASELEDKPSRVPRRSLKESMERAKKGGY